MNLPIVEFKKDSIGSKIRLTGIQTKLEIIKKQVVIQKRSLFFETVG